MPLLKQAAARLRRHPAIYDAARSSLVRVRGLLPPRTVAGVPGRVHRNDLMYEAGHADAYLRVGRQAVAVCGESLGAAGRSWSDVHAALDFGCGHGRVARHLAAALPAGGRLTVCDLDAEAVRFVASELGAGAIVSDRDLTKVDLGQQDLVWAGSVATHLPRDTWLQWVALIARSLKPGGLFVFSSHAPECLDRDFSIEWTEHREELRAELASTGYAYVPYAYLPGGEYGLTAQTEAGIDADLGAVGLTRVLHRAAGWEYQDVHAFRL